MKIKIIRGVVVCGVATQPGQVIDAPEGVSKMLIRTGKAIEVIEFSEPEPLQQIASRVVEAPKRKVGRPSKQSKKES